MSRTCKGCTEGGRHSPACKYYIEPSKTASNDLLSFGVIAGKYECDGNNCKYSEDFKTLDEAIDAIDKVNDYPWAYIEYKGRILEVCRKGYSPFER